MSTVNVHPGEALQEFLDDYGLSQSALARGLRVPVRRINAIVRGERGLTADTAVRLAKFFDNRADSGLGFRSCMTLKRLRKSSLQNCPKFTRLRLKFDSLFSRHWMPKPLIFPTFGSWFLSRAQIFPNIGKFRVYSRPFAVKVSNHWKSKVGQAACLSAHQWGSR